MAAEPTVAVDDDLAAGQTGVALRPTHHEAAGGVDEEEGFLGEEVLGQHLLDDFLDAEFLDGRMIHVGGVLGGDHHVGNGHRAVVLVHHGDLRLGVGAQPRGELSGLANLGELPAQAVGEHDRRGHELRRLVARVAEHQALVTGTLLRLLLALGRLGVDALGDVGRLLGDVHVHHHLVGVEHIVVVHIADFANGLAGQLHVVELGLGGDLTADHGDVGLHVGFTGDAAELVLRKAGVQDGIGDRVGDLVGMALADGLGREDEAVAHER